MNPTLKAMLATIAQEHRERGLHDSDADDPRAAHVAEELPLLLRQAHQAVDAALLSTARAGGLGCLNLSALHVLRLVGVRGRSIGGLARDLGVSPQAASKTVALLEQEGLVAKEPHPRDASAILVVLTGMAGEAREILDAALDDLVRRWTEDLPPGALEPLVSALDVLAAPARRRPRWDAS